jgi:prepilin-type N-terminal cleavage/methylation domain-containing protein
MQGQKGFTLIEILLVVTILGFMLAVILPRGLRTSVDAKYNLIRQSCTELAGYANQWVEQQMLASDITSTATDRHYFRSLADPDGGAVPADGSAAWIADSSDSNWNETGSNFSIQGRVINTVIHSKPEVSVEGIIDPSMIPRNPFNGASVFLSVNQPNTRVIPGAIACSYAEDISTGARFDYFALIFQGTDSTVADPDPSAAGVDFHGGMNNSTIQGLRNGVFLAKVRQ